LAAICRILDNNELLSRIVDFEIGSEALSMENCIWRLTIKQENGYDCEDEVEFIASHFYVLDDSELARLSNCNVESTVDLLERILSSRCLRLQSGTVCRTKTVWLNLFHRVEENIRIFMIMWIADFLTSSGISQFLASISIEDVNTNIWESVCGRLRCELPNSNLHDNRFGTLVFRYQGEMNSKESSCI
jgi:hypothetical protein